MANVVLPGQSAHPSLLPFGASELALVLGVGSLGAALANYAGAGGETVAAGCVLFLVLSYFAALLAKAAGRPRELTFVPDGGVGGCGYVDAFRAARQSLLLMHLDDDAPVRELLTLYASLLDRGVQVRRMILVRPDHDAGGLRWIAEFGAHVNLQQRITASPAATLPLSFAIVDEGLVLIAVPGFHVTDSEPYTERMVLRHLLVLRRTEVTRAFLEIYEKLWLRAKPIEPACLKHMLPDDGPPGDRQRRPSRLSTC